MNKRIDYEGEKRMLSISECQNYCGLGRNSARTLMHKIGAEIKIGNRCLYDKKIIDTYFDSFNVGRNELQ